MMDEARLTSGHRGTGPYAGVIRMGADIVWVCPHPHPNREHTTFSDVGARRCAALVLEALLQGDAPVKAFERFMESATAMNYGPETLRTHARLRWAYEESRRLAVELRRESVAGRRAAAVAHE